ncbi:hypothetical protein J5U23_01661 [Saccharolobus shibatae B12]|uniref:Uncharacterized protein n=2 Tax=Saccharolobus shibatae TaxID=2286 RepID=A0A8F5BP02_SACSH|nr:hypothetical protein [Saccharolobus shibatae]QXJ28792.1 hypothetical protein J5U23_01661 [Saccharolobus shibatae B12]QXJ35093.1 hypothetical protein J5U22_01640 [Saccharolobus shibatae]
MSSRNRLLFYIAGDVSGYNVVKYIGYLLVRKVIVNPCVEPQDTNTYKSKV